jgi:solute carrier family 36 (proton-coupled amino acid transporter)
MTTSLKSTFDSTFGLNISTWFFAGVLCCFMIPVAWVRNFAKFSFTFIAGNVLILLVILMLSAQSFAQIYSSGIATEIEVVKPQGLLPMIGFVIYAFEGIGVVMPIMSQAQEPDQFLRMLVSAIVTLTGIYIVFGSICYLAFGDSLMIIVTEMMPPGLISSSVKVLFCVNLIFSYSIIIHPTNAIIEGWLFKDMKSR